ncbi:uncharacterized protein LOC123443588 [Hordeum vulgare subsp. vulgare]|uniref:Predicted protein n=1 Tax=Hordeum vulgare subsp. vulgare TaxID=112509 RepID=F2D8R2_HORVV|nr:uncharacterized protein LOC123443588 [Hordeum vulgare subsp. vulgare]XP_044975958.1 uncharacterized protein LOC123443588 [Hordeum vulgare subsp. vulgare]XP_044975959.1 uncharacterized protein LOC123443588 [Hordeum vulgare subsp. vulgare]BAJ91483.1 predicted protein [Hordeum vulgare subsp. vulgare]
MDASSSFWSQIQHEDLSPRSPITFPPCSTLQIHALPMLELGTEDLPLELDRISGEPPSCLALILMRPTATSSPSSRVQTHKGSTSPTPRSPATSATTRNCRSRPRSCRGLAALVSWPSKPPTAEASFLLADRVHLTSDQPLPEQPSSTGPLATPLERLAGWTPLPYRASCFLPSLPAHTSASSARRV